MTAPGHPMKDSTTDRIQHWRFIEFNERRAMRGAAAARVEVDDEGEWLWMTPKDIRLNIRDHGDHPELQKALQACGGKPAKIGRSHHG